MKVLIAADYYSPYSGNFIGSLLDLGFAMRKRGNELCFLFPLHEKERFWVQTIRDLGFQVFHFDMKQKTSEIIHCLNTLIQDQGIDMIHAHFGLFYHFFLFENKQLVPVKILLHDHMGFSHHGSIIRQWIKNLLRALLFKKNKIGIISVQKEKNLSYFLNFGRHWYIPNGLSVRRCVAESLSREERRREKEISPEIQLVLAFGWDCDIKGIDIAINAVHKLRDNNPYVELAIVIQDEKLPSNDREYIIQQTGLDPQKTSWIHLWPSSEDVFSYYRAADVFLSSSRTESFSYAILEAISQNSSVVMSNIKGTAWAGEYSKTRAFRSEDYEDCAVKISESLVASDCSNREDIIEQFSIVKWTERIQEVYDFMMKG